MMLAQILLIAIVCGSAADVSPSSADIAQLETVRVLEPLASPTRTRGQSVVEFAPTVETRNVVCESTDDAVFTCRFESRTKDMFASEFSPWVTRTETVSRTAAGRWRFR